MIAPAIKAALPVTPAGTHFRPCGFTFCQFKMCGALEECLQSKDMETEGFMPYVGAIIDRPCRAFYCIQGKKYGDRFAKAEFGRGKIMEYLETLERWLRAFPLWGQEEIRTDALPLRPGSVGLFPQGVEVLEEKTDLLGNVSIRCRQKFELQKVVCPGEDPARWLLQLQQWMLEQSALGLAPRFGDVPAAEQIRAEKGRLKEITAAGTAVYTVTITAEFVKRY